MIDDRIGWISFTGRQGEWRYDPGQPLGARGGFGQVYAGEASDGRPFAVKAVEKRRANGPLDQRLLDREIEIGLKIEAVPDSMLLPAFDVGQTADHLLLVMDRADRSLADRTGPLDHTTLVEVLIDITTGLEQLHDSSIFHRDLKPANVLLHHGRWKLADFGIARDDEIGTQSITFDGAGSPPYMAPELWDRRSPTAKTDLYALGCLAYELLTGSTPFLGGRTEQRSGHLTESPPIISGSDVLMSNLIGRLLAKDPAMRPQDAHAVMERLRHTTSVLSPALRTIATRVGERTAADTERAAEKARRAAEAGYEEQQKVQSISDFREILTDALRDLRAAQPDVRLVQTVEEVSVPAGFTLTDDFAFLTFALSAPRFVEIDDPMLVAGTVQEGNRNVQSRTHLAANVGYESVAGRMEWRLYQFSQGQPRFKYPVSGATPKPIPYDYGPAGRPHGLPLDRFSDPKERLCMYQGRQAAWNLTRCPLTADTIVLLFLEALELHAPTDPRGW